jgi:hypothetical protein
MNDVRCLYRPGHERAPRTNVVPNGPNRHAIEVRETLGQFIEANLMRPLYFDDSQNEARITEALDTMTLAERITIEIEMQSRRPAVHSFDYDPLR